MTLKLHIHFGIHRTGTTSIHSTMVSNLVALRECGILYPELGVDHRHVRVAWKLLSKKIGGLELCDLIHAEVSPSTQKVVLSSEDFSLMKDGFWLKALSEKFDISASLYLRRQDLWLESWYNQNIKWPWDRRLSAANSEQFLDKKDEFYWLDYSWLLSSIERYVDSKKIYVQTMESGVVENTTFDFLKHLGIESEIEIKNPRNASLTKCQLDILRKIDLYDVRPNQRMKIIRALRELVIDECSNNSAIFDRAQRDLVLSSYEASNRDVSNKYFGRDKLFEELISYPEIDRLEDSLVYKKYIPLLIKNL
jgi:hypothetical protein